MTLPFISPIRQDVDKEDIQSGYVKEWSFSALMSFLECPHRTYLKRVLRKVGTPRNEEANRGDDLHKKIEAYIKGDADTLPAGKDGVKFHREYIETLRTLYENGCIILLEDEWGFDVNWESTGWYSDDVWARIKLDSIKFEDEKSAVIDDWKSGKKFGNEAKHKRQLQLYAIGAFLKYPELEFVKGYMRYIDQATDNILSSSFSREQAMRLLPSWTNNAIMMTSCKTFEPKPNRNNCMFCDYNKPHSEYLCEFRVNDWE